MYSSYLVASKFVLRKINSGVWFVQTFLQKMLYIAKPPNFPYTFSAVNMWIMNQFHTHSQKKQNQAKKFIKSGQIEIARRMRRWDRAVEVRSSGGEIGLRGAAIDERRGAAIDKRCGSIIRLELGLWSSDWSSGFAGKVSSSSLFAIEALSPLSLSLRKCFEVKLGTENNFRGQNLIFTINWK